jgi:hypothetical protein
MRAVQVPQPKRPLNLVERDVPEPFLLLIRTFALAEIRLNPIHFKDRPTPEVCSYLNDRLHSV